MKFTNFKTVKLATSPAVGDNPPSGAVYEWHTLDNSNNLIINYRLSDGTSKTFTAGGSSSELPVTVLGSSGTQTIDRSISDKFTIAPTSNVTLDTINFVGMKDAIIDIENGSDYIIFPSSWYWTGDIPTPEFWGINRIKLSAFSYASTIKIKAEQVWSYRDSYGSYGNDLNTKLLVNFNSLPFIDESANSAAITNSGVTKDTVNKKFDRGSGFFGVGTYLSLPFISDYIFTTGDFTVECWIKNSQMTNDYKNFIGGTGDNPWTFQIMSDGTLHVYNGAFHKASTPVNDNSWHHVAWVRYNGISQIYVDGISDLSWSDSSNYGSMGALRIGYNDNGGSRQFAGNLDCVRISNIARWTANFNNNLPVRQYQ